jgi:hypothetical protein
MSKGGSQTSSTSIDPQIKEAFLQNVQQARNVAGALPVQQFAGYNPLYQAGEQQVVNQSLTPFTGQEIGGFMNPYQQEVIDRSLADIESSRQMADLRDRQAATQARAFGGSRQGVQSSLTNAAALKQAADLSANLRSQGYGQAAQLAQYARGQNIQGGQNVLALGGARQAFEQQQLDALRNIGIQRLGISQSALGFNPASLGGSTTTPYSRNVGAGALGGALAGSQLAGYSDGAFSGGEGAAIGALLGMFG